MADMKNASFEVESNIIATERLEDNAKRRRQGCESSSSSDLKIDTLARMIEALAFEVSRLEAEQHSEEAGASSTFALPNLNPYRGAKEQL